MAFPAESLEKCYRISNIPHDWTDVTLFHNLGERFGIQKALKHEFMLFPALDGQGKVGLLILTGMPAFFGKIRPETKGTEVVGPGITIDTHFYGLTPLHWPLQGNVDVDIVAVTGLGGHAFGSWRCHESRKLWLKDFLPREVDASMRVMTFGYDSSLTGSRTSKIDVGVYAKDLVEELCKARASCPTRPLIFLGHSLGCLVSSWVMNICSKEARYKDLYNSIRSFCFFGPPLGGLHTQELEEMVVDQSGGQDAAMLEFLAGLREKSRFLTQHRRDFVELWEGKSVLTFYEEVKTPTVKKNEQTGKWAREGDAVMMVRNRAGLHSEEEDFMPTMTDHTEIAKNLEPGERTFDLMVGHIETILKSELQKGK